jgi:murein L,D-transpeptidase YafK
MKNILLISFLLLSIALHAQPSFVSYQKSIGKIGDVFKRKEDTLRKQFEEKKLNWPARYIFLRSFKYEKKLELWVKDSVSQPFKLFKTYKVCNMSGTLGPKRVEGDYQVPEGFYYINEFNPNSNYHLSLKLNYPNISDLKLSDKDAPGGSIYIHGSCVTRGCLPLTDDQIEEVYIMASYAKSEGQQYIPVHIFPIVFRDKNSREYLNNFVKDNADYKPLLEKLEKAYYYFEKHHTLLPVMISTSGEYVLGTSQVEKLEDINDAGQKTVKKVYKRKLKPSPLNDEQLAKVVDKLPQYPGGIEAFDSFLRSVSMDMKGYLYESQKKTFVSVEFIIDENGKPVWARVVRGGNEEMNEQIEQRFEAMPNWEPAKRLDKNVAIKMTQSLMVGE